MKRLSLLFLAASALLLCCPCSFAQKKVVKKKKEEPQKTVQVGYGTQNESDVVGSISTMSSETLEVSNNPDLTESMTGKASGMYVSGETPGQEISFLIRGVSSWNGNNPLILVDGVERDMSYVITSEVDNISVLKDASATAVYGSKGANGVILITTKTGSFTGGPSHTLQERMEDSLATVNGPVPGLEPLGWLRGSVSSLTPDCSPSALEKLEDDFYNRRTRAEDFRTCLAAALEGRGFALLTYGPFKASYKLDRGPQLSVEEFTDYPFSEDIVLIVSVSYNAKFPVWFRIPSWCTKPSAKVNGEKAEVDLRLGHFLCLEREWGEKDKVVLSFPMDYSDSKSGPLKLVLPDGRPAPEGELKAKKKGRLKEADPFVNCPVSFSVDGTPVQMQGSTVK